MGVDHGPAPDRRHRRIAADHEPVPRGDDHNGLESHLALHRLAGRDRVGPDRVDPAEHLARPVVESDPGAPAQGARRVLEERYRRVKHIRRPQVAERGKHVTARHLRLRDAREVQRDALARGRRLSLDVVDLDAADPDIASLGKQLQAVAVLERTAPHGAGDHGADPLESEHAVNRHPGGKSLVLQADVSRRLVQQLLQVIDTGAGHCGHGDDGRALQARASQQLGDFVLDELQHVLVDEVRLGDGNDATGDAQEVEYRKVFPGLRHHGVVGRDDEQREVDTGRARHHVADEVLVAGDVDDAGDGPVIELERSEPEVDRYPAQLFLGQAVCVAAGEGAHQHGLAMVDVAGGTDYKVSVRHTYSLMPRPACASHWIRQRFSLPETTAATASASSPTSPASTVRMSSRSASSFTRDITGGSWCLSADCNASASRKSCSSTRQ